MQDITLPHIQQAKSLTEGVRIQRELLKQLLSLPMANLAADCAKKFINNKMKVSDLESLLKDALPGFSYCKHLFVLNDQFIQITNNIIRQGVDSCHLGRDRRGRPYLVNIVGQTDFKLSEAYISRRQLRPSLTAIQVIRNDEGKLIGFLGADFDMRELPHTEHCYKQPDNWHQLKGDPAIRSGLFNQQRCQSIVDENIDAVLANMHELITEYGVFHSKLHYSSNRATLWNSDDPFTYHLLTVNELTSVNIFLAYPKCSYLERSVIPIDQLKSILDMFKTLRFADETIYLRSSSINIVNGLIGLTFSCDGTHYMRYNEFLQKSTDFWFGKAGA